MSWRLACIVRMPMRPIAMIVLLAGIARAEPTDLFKPPSKLAKAQDRFVRGKQLFEAKQYTDAAVEFAAGYELDPHAKFLLFNVALAQRMAGACKDAIEAYRTFLDAGPPDALAKNARIGIERCEKLLAPAEGMPPDVKPDPVDKPVVDKPVDPPITHAPLVPQVSRPVTDIPPIVTVDVPWYRDRLGISLVGGGAACALVGATLYLLARRDADATFAPTSVADYLDNRRAAPQLQAASWIVGGAGAALVIAGTIRYATRPSRRSVAVVPASSGAVLVLDGRF
jgi:hypothetical protein